MTPEPKINSPNASGTWKLGRSVSRGLPCGIESRLGCAFHAIKIYFQTAAESNRSTKHSSATRSPQTQVFFASLKLTRRPMQTLQIGFSPGAMSKSIQSLRADFESLYRGVATGQAEGKLPRRRDPKAGGGGHWPRRLEKL